MEIHQAMRNARCRRHIGHRRLRIAAGSQAFDGGLDHLLLAVLPAGLAGSGCNTFLRTVFMVFILIDNSVKIKPDYLLIEIP